jgi:hypothetical protein
MGCYLLGLWCFDDFVEIFVTGSVVIPLFSIVPLLDYDSAFLVSTSLGWLSLFIYGGSDRLALIYSHFASITALCGPLRGLGHLFVIFPTYYNYLCAILVCF